MFILLWIPPGRAAEPCIERSLQGDARDIVANFFGSFSWIHSRKLSHNHDATDLDPNRSNYGQIRPRLNITWVWGRTKSAALLVDGSDNHYTVGGTLRLSSGTRLFLSEPPARQVTIVGVKRCQAEGERI